MAILAAKSYSRVSGEQHSPAIPDFFLIFGLTLLGK
jgi:hypothetical protein